MQTKPAPSPLAYGHPYLCYIRCCFSLRRPLVFSLRLVIRRKAHFIGLFTRAIVGSYRLRQRLLVLLR